MYRRNTSGESSHRQIQDAPEEVDGAALSDEARTEFAKDPVGLSQHTPEPFGILRVVRGMRFVLVERNSIRHLIRPLADLDRQAKTRQLLHQAPIEDGHRFRLERKAADGTIAR